MKRHLFIYAIILAPVVYPNASYTQVSREETGICSQMAELVGILVMGRQMDTPRKIILRATVGKDVALRDLVVDLVDAIYALPIADTEEEKIDLVEEFSRSTLESCNSTVSLSE